MTLRSRHVAIAAVAGLLASAAAIFGGVWLADALDDTTPIDGEFVLEEPGIFSEPTDGVNPDVSGIALPRVELTDVRGVPVELTDYLGAPLVVNFWFSRCAPCRRELRDFATVDAELGDRVQFVGVDPFDTVEAMQRFAAERGVAYDLLISMMAACPTISASSATRSRCSSAPKVSCCARRVRSMPTRCGRPSRNSSDGRLSLMGLSFLRGLVAAVNPCAFVMLPTYLMYFLGMEGHRPGDQRATVRRARSLVSAAVSAGFMVVFVVVGIVSEYATRQIEANAQYATVVIGLGFIVLGIAMLCGYQLPITTPRRPDGWPRSHARGDGAVRRRICGGLDRVYLAALLDRRPARHGGPRGMGNRRCPRGGVRRRYGADRDGAHDSLAIANTSLLRVLEADLATSIASPPCSCCCRASTSSTTSGSST